MIPLWVTGDSLAHPDILADEGDFQTQCSRCTPKHRLTFYWACAVFAVVASTLQLHSETSHYHTHGRHLNILWTRCADIDWAEDICHMRSTLFTHISCGWAHLCWQRTRWEVVIWSVPPQIQLFLSPLWLVWLCGAGMTSLLHFHVESFIQHRAGGWPPLISVPIVHADYHWTKYRMSI